MAHSESVVSAAEMKRLDERTISLHGIPSLVLMERAALAAVETLLAEGFDLSRTYCFCGPGNNGGDGLAVTRLLCLGGIDARAVFVGDPEKRSAETAHQQKVCESYGISPLSLGEYEEQAAQAAPTAVVDAIFGIGGGRAPSGAFADAIAQINKARASGARVLSLDIPSGVSADTGKAAGIAVQADATVTFAYRKLGHTLPPGSALSGRLIVKDIGIYSD